MVWIANWIQLLHMNREETQEFLRNPTEKLDLIVPRGGETLDSVCKGTRQMCCIGQRKGQ